MFFLLGFGFFGYVFHNIVGLEAPLLVLLFAGLSGLIIALLLLYMITRLFGNSESATEQDVSDRTGLLGKVSTTIQEGGLGEILYVSPGGMRKSIPARSMDGQRLERNQEVVVVSYQNGIAEVDTWEHFINEEGTSAGTSESSLMGSDGLETLRTLLDESSKTDSQALVMRKDSQKE
jgi:membrane protein implicated in regulation of membrane protease activity